MSRKKNNNRVLSDRPLKKTVDVRETVTDWYIVLMLLIFPLWLPGTYSEVNNTKFYFFAAATSLWFVMLVIFSFMEGPPKGFFTPARVAAMVFAAICLLSALLSPFDFRSLLTTGRHLGLVTELLLALVLIGVSRFGHCRERHFVAFGISITIFSFICILQRLGKNPLGLYGIATNYDKGFTGFIGTIGNIDLVTALISLAVPLFLGLSVKSEAPYDKIYLIPLFFSSLLLTLCRAQAGRMGVGVVAVVVPAFLVRSMKDLRRTLGAAALALPAAALGYAFRGSMTDGVLSVSFEFGSLGIAFLVLAVVFAAVAWLLRFVRWEPSGHVFRNTFIVFAVVAVIGALTVVYFWPGKSGTIYEASQLLHGHFEDSYGTGRLAIWRATLEKGKDMNRPLLGNGPGSYVKLRVIPKKYFIADLPHNVYLQFLLETGVVGLLNYLSLIVISLFVRRREQWKPVHSCLILAAMSYAVQDFFGLGMPVTSPFFWIILGLLQADTHEKPETAEQ